MKLRRYDWIIELINECNKEGMIDWLNEWLN